MKKKENRLVVGSRAWADIIPEWILKEVESERVIISMINLAGKNKLEDHEQVGDAEVIAYLCPATMEAPMDRDYAEIYIYLSSTLMIKTKRAKKESLPPEFKEALEKDLSDYQKSLLRELRCKIFKARGGKPRIPIIDALEEVFKESKKKNGRKKTKTLKKASRKTAD